MKKFQIGLNLQKVAPEAKLIIVGNKVDLEFKVSKAEIQKLEKQMEIPVHLTSAKVELKDDLSNVCNVFDEIAQKIIIQHKQDKNNE